MKEELYTVTKHDIYTSYRPSNTAWAVIFIPVLDEAISKKKCK
jgi:hypothetical protein